MPISVKFREVRDSFNFFLKFCFMMHLTHCLLRSICPKCIDIGSGSELGLRLWLGLGLAQWLKCSCEAGELT